MSPGVLDRADGFERVVYATDAAAGLRSIVAIHSTRLGPALGGCRIRAYASEDEALTDVLRLAEAMTWKAAAAGLDLGGGKAVVIADPQRDKTEALLRAFGRVIDSLGGRFITSVDVGSSVADLDVMSRETRWVVGLSPFNGGSGDPSPATARGVLGAIRACLQHRWRDVSLDGRKVAVQGAGKVGFHLCVSLAQQGAEVVVADPNADALGALAAEVNVRTVDPDAIVGVDCDIFAPCALGGVLDAETIPHISAPIVCGSANNQLASTQDAKRIADAGILYAPDFIVNAGGLISVVDELDGWNADRVFARVDAIGRTLLDVLHLAAETDSTPHDAAVEFAKRRIRTLDALNP